jgi:hypothetical protein
VLHLQTKCNRLIDEMGLSQTAAGATTLTKVAQRQEAAGVTNTFVEKSFGGVVESTVL